MGGSATVLYYSQNFWSRCKRVFVLFAAYVYFETELAHLKQSTILQTFMGLFDELHEMHKFKEMGRRWSY